MSFDNFYDLIIEEGFSIEPISGCVTTHADGGFPRIQDLYDRVYYNIEFLLFPLNNTLLYELNTFYENNLSGEWEWIHPVTNVNYNVMFRDAPIEENISVFDITVRLLLIGYKI